MMKGEGRGTGKQRNLGWLCSAEVKIDDERRTNYVRWEEAGRKHLLTLAE
jgi:hypothetical protein